VETSNAPTPITPFERLGGQTTLQAIVDRFYDLMDSDPAYAELRAMHGPDLTKMRTSLASFLAGWAGGPRDWFQANPGRCMMSVHRPFAIGSEVARQWAEAMTRAIADVGPADGAIARELAERLVAMATAMGR
jgi:hemoglobin